jgi:hypothetical protein
MKPRMHLETDMSQSCTHLCCLQPKYVAHGPYCELNDMDAPSIGLDANHPKNCELRMKVEESELINIYVTITITLTDMILKTFSCNLKIV